VTELPRCKDATHRPSNTPADAPDSPSIAVVPGEGALVLEVKGCHKLEVDDGAWYYGNNAAPEYHSPFRQASEAMHSLRRRLADRHRQFVRIPFWTAVCFPFIDFTESSEEWHPWQVIDRRALTAQPVARLS